METEKPQDDKHKNLVKHCIDLFNEFKKSEYRQTKLQEIKEARETYEQKPEAKVKYWKGESNVTLPMETISIDNLEPRLIAGLTGKEPIVAFGDKGQLDEVGEALENWYNKELKDVVKIEEVARHVVHTILLDGTRFSICEYDKKEAIKSDFVYDEAGQITMDEETNMPFYREYVDTVFEGGKDTSIPFNDMYIPDDIGTVEEWETCDKIRMLHLSYGELMEKKDEPGYHNIGAWLLPDGTQKRLKEEDKSPSQQVAGVDVTGKETIRCIECHISYAIDNLKEEDEKKRASFAEDDVIITIALDQELLIRKILRRDVNMNNQTLLKRQRLFAEEGRSYGSGIHGKMKAIQAGASNVFNRMMNIADIAILPWYFYEEGAGIRGKQEIMPGEGIKVDDVSKIKFAEFRINPAQYIEFLKIFFDLWERVISISEPQLGKQKGSGTTATEIMAVIQEGNIKHNYQASTFKEEFLSIVKTLYDLYYQYMPYDATLEYGGDEVPFPRQMMRRPNNFTLTGSTELANKLIERKENEDLFNMTIQDPYFNPIVIREDLLKSYGRQDTGKYINPELNQLLQLAIEQPEAVMAAVQPIVQAIEEEGQEGG